jgi:hypothetical protein
MIANRVKVGLVYLGALGMSDNSVTQTSGTPIGYGKRGRIHPLPGWCTSRPPICRMPLTSLLVFPFSSHYDVPPEEVRLKRTAMSTRELRRAEVLAR